LRSELNGSRCRDRTGGRWSDRVCHLPDDNRSTPDVRSLTAPRVAYVPQNRSLRLVVVRHDMSGICRCTDAGLA
jgi:hypothetical protein